VSIKGTHEMKCVIVISMCMMALTGCATRSKVAQELALGMTRTEVLHKAGKPFSKSCRRDADGNLIEVWSYNETTWDDGGWTADRTIITTNIYFENDEVKSYENAGERAVASPDSMVIVL
jgi:hypothetical protein